MTNMTPRQSVTPTRATIDAGEPEPGGFSATPHDRVRLFATSVLVLFLELALIRYLPAQVRVVGYYTNLILIATFLGLGIGFLLARHKLRLAPVLLPAILVTVAANQFFQDVFVRNPETTDEPLWLPFSGSAAWSIESIVLAHFLLVTATFVPMGQLMGRLFGRLRRLEAYALDLTGSLVGVVAFGVFSALETPPTVWFGLSALLALGVVSVKRFDGFVGLCFGVALFAVVWRGEGEGRIWSPYYMVEIQPENAGAQPVLVNGALHQIMLDFDLETDYIQKTRRRFEAPYRRASKLDDVLIVGAGTGNDVAIATRLGAKHIDAVEIDPVFPEIGRVRHPQAPYAGQGVMLFVRDARSYFKQCRKKYDLIVFGTLDSQTLLSGLSSIRLDNYVYTLESFQDAYALLKPEGRLVVFHMSMYPYIAARIDMLLTKVAGRDPLLRSYEDHTLFNMVFEQGAGLPAGSRPPGYHEFRRGLKLATDDWPYLYLRNPGVPWHYAKVLLGMAALALMGTTAAVGGRWRQFDLRLFFLGAGFLLLETAAVTKMSLLFGSTWAVNLLVFASILLVLVVANWQVDRGKTRGRRVATRRLLMALIVILIALSFLQTAAISALPRVAQWLVAGTIVALPIGLAGLIFPALFEEAQDSQTAFASNLLGAIAGGIAEYGSMWFGIRVLGLFAAFFYAAALVVGFWRPRGSGGGA